MVHLRKISILLLAAFSSFSYAEEAKENDERRIVVRQKQLTSTTNDQIPVEAITEISHDHIQEVLHLSPSTTMQRGSGQESLLAIRSPVLTGAGACGAFLVLEDDIPVRPAGLCNINQLFDVHSEQASSIDILAGPGNSFFGSNAMHGVVSVKSAEIKPDQLMLGVKLGEEDNYQTRIRISDQLANTGYLLALTVKDDAGFRKNSGLEEQKLTARYQWELDASSELSIGLTASELRQETAGYIIGEDAYLDEDARKSNGNPEAYRNSSSYRWWLRYSSWIDDNKELLITPYMRRSEMSFLMHFLPGQPVETNEQTSLGIQSAIYHDVTRNWLLSYGIDVEVADGELVQYQPEAYVGSAFLEATLPQGYHYDYAVDVSQLAVYADSQYQLEDDWLLSMGLRFERLEYDYDNRMNSGRVTDTGATCGFGGCRYSRPEDRTDSFTEPNWFVQLSHDLSEYQQISFKISEGYRAPQATELYRLQREQVIADLDAESIFNKEISYKYQLDMAYISLSFYGMKKTDVIFRDSNFFTISGGETHHQGIEWQVNMALTEHLQLSAQGSLSEHEYGDIRLIDGVDIQGNQVDTAPRQTGSIQLRYLYQDHQISLDYQTVGDYYLDIENVHKYGGHQLLNLRWTCKLDANWQFRLHALNLLNEAYAERADFTGFSGYRYFPGLDRRFQLEVRWHQ